MKLRDCSFRLNMLFLSLMMSAVFTLLLLGAGCLWYSPSCGLDYWSLLSLLTRCINGTLLILPVDMYCVLEVVYVYLVLTFGTILWIVFHWRSVLSDGWWFCVGRSDKLWICMEYCGGGSMQDIYHGTKLLLLAECWCFVTNADVRRQLIWLASFCGRGWVARENWLIRSLSRDTCPILLFTTLYDISQLHGYATAECKLQNYIGIIFFCI